ncbi:PIN domain-containing protein [Stutzerimonas stutzeri]|uniref:PIN-like domain-containing protein n=1 Tax=Stutzerimonas sp. S1 TaxID=3030652 RepID=UPI0022251677|nr:PIN domain-containing protein [Stutzerimonas sp. S1]MCW3150049.1 PIN domain-containing protein [Stutzerimonas sp. S1]
MKNLFPGHFAKEENAHRDLWSKCIFVFDANILLNLYRYSEETKTTFLQILDLLKERTWIPYQAAHEYIENRLKVIDEQQEKYTTTLTEVSTLSSKLEHPRQHPFVSKSVMNRVEKSLQSLKSELEANKETHVNRIHEDDIKDQISTIFNNRVGNKLSDDQLEEIIKEGEKRYAEKIPPGYADNKKASAETFLAARCKPYGDLIVWKSIIEKSKADNLPVIFVTDDGKEDWWLRFKGKTLGPRPELIQEFIRETGMDFHMYQPERFLSLAGDFLKEKTSREALQEIRELRETKQLSESASIVPPSMGHFSSILKSEKFDDHTSDNDLYHNYVMLSAEKKFLRQQLDDLHLRHQMAVRRGRELPLDYDEADIENSLEYQSIKSECIELESQVVETHQKLAKVLKLIHELERRLLTKNHDSITIKEWKNRGKRKEDRFI